MVTRKSKNTSSYKMKVDCLKDWMRANNIPKPKPVKQTVLVREKE